MAWYRMSKVLREHSPLPKQRLGLHRLGTLCKGGRSCVVSTPAPPAPPRTHVKFWSWHRESCPVRIAPSSPSLSSSFWGKPLSFAPRNLSWELSILLLHQLRPLWGFFPTEIFSVIAFPAGAPREAWAAAAQTLSPLALNSPSPSPSAGCWDLSRSGAAGTHQTEGNRWLQTGQRNWKIGNFKTA